MQWIDTIDDEPLVKRQQDFRGGVNSFDDPAQLGDMVLQAIEDMVVEDNGLARTRPGADALGGAALAAARIEALVYFDTPSLEYLYASISASLRQWNGSSWSTIAAYPLGASSIVEMAQGANLLYVSDGSGQWYDYTGAAWSGALGNTTSDPPNGASIMCWHTNRMFATGTIASIYDQVYVSDIGDAGTGKWNHTSNAFRVGRGEGQRITAMCGAKGFWLAIGKEDSLYMAYADPVQSVSQWQVLRVAASVGVVGKRAMVSFGDFVVVLSRDGLRKVSANANQEDIPWEISPPFSEPMQPYIDRINWSSASKSVLHKFRHYLLCAVPLDSATEPSHVLVWNSRLGVWMGVWTGWTPTAMATTLFASEGPRLVVGDSAGKVNLWKDYASLDLASTFQENSAEIGTLLSGKAQNFDLPQNWKDGAFAQCVCTGSQGNADMVVFLDGVEQKRQTFSLAQTQNQLPVDLPFDLAVVTPKLITMALDGLPEFLEAYIQIETDSAKIQVKSLAIAAYVNTMKNE